MPTALLPHADRRFLDHYECRNSRPRTIIRGNEAVQETGESPRPGLQWGRVFFDAESCTTRRYASPVTVRFNGAADDRRRKQDTHIRRH
jgi:hypothetical protein